MTDPDLIEARSIIGKLQSALDTAQARIRATEATMEQLNMRLIAANEHNDALESMLWRLQAMQSNADVPT